ncbi:MAG: peptide deformylase [Candidatus Neomarinimicrobiota bacterium]
MTVLPVVKYGETILRKKMRSVEDISQLSILVDDMFDTMYEEDGIGLAANQVNVNLNLCVIDISHTEESDSPFVFINGKILEKWGESVMEEGCLSVPGIRVDVSRSEGIRFRYEDLSGADHEEKLEGLLARVIQHEMDHLNGRLILDRVSPVIRKQLKNQLREIATANRDESAERKTV